MSAGGLAGSTWAVCGGFHASTPKWIPTRGRRRCPRCKTQLTAADLEDVHEAGPAVSTPTHVAYLWRELPDAARRQILEQQRIPQGMDMLSRPGEE